MRLRTEKSVRCSKKEDEVAKVGVVKNLFYSRYWVREKGVDPVPFPSNGIMDGGDASLEDLIKDSRKGVLVTLLWYIRNS